MVFSRKERRPNADGIHDSEKRSFRCVKRSTAYGYRLSKASVSFHPQGRAGACPRRAAGSYEFAGTNANTQCFTAGGGRDPALRWYQYSYLFFVLLIKADNHNTALYDPMASWQFSTPLFIVIHKKNRERRGAGFPKSAGWSADKEDIYVRCGHWRYHRFHL